MLRSVRALLVLIVVIFAAFLLSGCAASSGQETTTPGTTEAAPIAAATSSDIPNTPAAQTAAPEATAPPSEASTAAPTVGVEPQTPAATADASGNPNAGADSVTSIPDPAGYQWSAVASGFTRPVDIADPGDGSGRLFVLEQIGVIRVIENGVMLPEPFLDLRDRVGTSGNERGLLGIALHPNFAENRYFYLNYTNLSGDTVISRFTVSETNPNQADPGSEKELLYVDQPYANHNGGVLAFGPDGYLYAGLGDGGSAGDPRGNGQSLNTLLGKILRIDVDGGDPYAIPSDNPFAQGGGKPEIWAYGLRNPWRFSFDRQTGDLYIADVGQGEWEEIDFQPAGARGGQNYGWKFREGAHDFDGQAPAGAALVEPVSEYSHGDGCSVTGGFVYRGQALPDFRGVYLFADYCSGKMWAMLKGADGTFETKELFQTGMNITSFGQDSQGELYITDQASGSVYRLTGK
jgi:glucose/arabinose dehydrogenase